ncbi:MAG: flavin reductase family protein [Stappiaceae bacterium]
MNMHNPNIVREHLEPRALRDVLGCFATGVAVVTTCDTDAVPVGMTINSFASVSLDPPEILWSIASNASSRNAFVNHGAFAINIMSAQDKDRTLQFARPAEDKFRGVDWRPGWRGVPVLSLAMATLECELKQCIPSGDHEIVIGSVKAIDRRSGDPLIFYRGEFSELGSTL